jgi:hypothetical protein
MRYAFRQALCLLLHNAKSMSQGVPMLSLRQNPITIALLLLTPCLSFADEVKVAVAQCTNDSLVTDFSGPNSI